MVKPDASLAGTGVHGLSILDYAEPGCIVIPQVLNFFFALSFGALAAIPASTMAAPIDCCLQRTQTIDDGIKGGGLDDDHAGTDHGLRVIAQRGQCGIFRNAPQLPGQAGVAAGVARIVESPLVFDGGWSGT